MVELGRYAGSPQLVRYLNRTWPDEALLAQHGLRYPGIALELYERSQGTRRRIWAVAADGRLAEYREHALDPNGELLAEHRYTPDGELIERTEYEYGSDGALAVTREYDGDGRLVSEWES